MLISAFRFIFNYMVEYKPELSKILDSLSDKTRRDIVQRVIPEEMTINQIASEYNMSVAAISKHVSILEVSGVIIKRKEGRARFVSFNPEAKIILADYVSSMTI